MLLAVSLVFRVTSFQYTDPILPANQARTRMCNPSVEVVEAATKALNLTCAGRPPETTAR